VSARLSIRFSKGESFYVSTIIRPDSDLIDVGPYFETIAFDTSDPAEKRTLYQHNQPALAGAGEANASRAHDLIARRLARLRGEDLWRRVETL
jgi:hypothetical protein